MENKEKTQFAMEIAATEKKRTASMPVRYSNRSRNKKASIELPKVRQEAWAEAVSDYLSSFRR